MSKEKKHRYLWLKITLPIFLVLLPAIVLTTLCFSTPALFGETFLGELTDKYERLNTIDEPKIVIIGGSSVAFGLDSRMLEEYTGMKVVNFGLYATLGTKLMLDLSKSNINEGDIIIIAPETDSQTMSLYFNAEATWQSVDGNFDMMKYIGADNRGAMVGELFDFTVSKLGYMKNGAPDPEGVYRHDSFNEYGDISYKRPGNIMAMGYDPSKVISLNSDIIDSEFVTYVNDYTKWAEDKGAKVWFSYSPMNKSALSHDTTDESIYEFFIALSQALRCPIIGNIQDSILDEGYFYDSNYHLNDAGVIVHTASIIRDILRS